MKKIKILIITTFLSLTINAQNPVPSIAISSNTACENTSISLSGSASPSNSSVFSWQWSCIPATANFSSATNPNTQFTATSAGTYTISLTVTPGGNTTTTTVTINPIPTVTITPSSYTICVGGLGVELIANGTAATYNWAPSTGLNSTTGQNVIATPTTNTTYTVIGMLNGCLSTTSSQITALIVSSLPVLATSPTSTILCGNQTSILLTANGTGGQPPYSYIWNQNITTQSINAPVGTQTIQLTDANGCVDTSSVIVSSNPLPDVTTTLNSITISSNEVGADYQWLDCDNLYSPIFNENNPSYTATNNGNYAVEVTKNGCIDTSNCVNINTVNLQENPNSLNNNFKIYPNPSTEILEIDLRNMESSNNEYKISFKNLLGEIIYSIKTNKAKNTININSFPSGIYYINIECQKTDEWVKFIKK